MSATGANPGGARFYYAPDAIAPRADGIHLRHRSSSGLGRQTVVDRQFWRCPDSENGRLAEQITMWDTHNTRKPILLLRLSGLLLLRAAERALAALLFDSGVTLRFAKR